MVEQEMMNVINSYGKAYKTWSKVFASWSKPMINFPSALSAINMESWSKPLQSHLSHWNNKNTDYFKMMMGMYFPPESMDNITDAGGNGKDSKPS